MGGGGVVVDIFLFSITSGGHGGVHVDSGGQ